jgi:hypothetical protein
MTPNFFLVGTTKGGTSSLDLWLRSHPDVATPKRKEMHFFCACPSPKLHIASNLEEYISFFPDGKAVGESSPCYLYHPDIPARLAQFPGVRIIVSLRDPVERFWSHYLMKENYRPTGITPYEVLDSNLEEGRSNAIEDLFGMGLYGAQLEPYLKMFEDSVLVLFLEETSANPRTTMDKIQEFLGLQIIDIDTSKREKEYMAPRGFLGRTLLQSPVPRATGNLLLPAGIRRSLKEKILVDMRKPEMPEDLHRRLRDLYAADSSRLEDLLKRDLPWSNLD